MKIRTKSVKERNFLINVAAAAGLMLHDNHTAETFEKAHPFRMYPILMIIESERSTSFGVYRVTASSYEGNDIRNIEDALKYIASQVDVPPVIKVVLNDKYTAEISEDNVTVGCQSFPKSKIKELYEAAYTK